MATPSPAAVSAAPLPSSEDLDRARAFTREDLVHDGESLEEVLALGSARRRAVDAALAEIEAGLDYPSVEWRRTYSLMLGLERLLSVEEPKLADGKTTLNSHQVDALSGTLIALVAELQDRANGNGGGSNGKRAASNGGSAAPAPSQPEAKRPAAALAKEAAEAAKTLALEDDEDDEEAVDLELDDLDEIDDDELDAQAEAEPEPDPEEEAAAAELDEEVSPDEEPLDWDDSGLDEDVELADQPEDANAARRFWFEHAT